MSDCSRCGGLQDRQGQRYCRACHNAYMRQHRPAYGHLSQTDKDKSTARAYANVYQGRGKIEKKPCCICGSDQNVEKHHEDYSKPLEVIFFCRDCHRTLHQVTGLKQNYDTHETLVNQQGVSTP